MLPVVLKLKLATDAAVGLTASGSPAPVPAEALATVVALRAAAPVEVKLFDETLGIGAMVGIRRRHDGRGDRGRSSPWVGGVIAPACDRPAAPA